MAFDDTNVPVIVTVDSSQLKEMIKDFDGSVEATKRLDAATASVKNQFDSQRKAIIAVNQAQRVNNIQIIESLRLVRTFTATFSSLNQVYQTLLLRQIATTQSTVAQDEAFERITGKTANLVNALDILGPANEDVKSGFDNLIDSADNLNSNQLTDLIANLDSLKDNSKLSADEQVFLNNELESLKKILEETKLKEKQKEFEDFFGIFTSLATAGGSIGTLALNLAKFGPELTALAGTLARFKPEIAIIVLLLFGPEVAKELGLLQTAGENDITSKSALDDLNSVIQGKGIPGAPDFFNAGRGAFNPNSPEAIQNFFNIEKIEISNEADLYRWAEKIVELQKQNQSKGVK